MTLSLSKTFQYVIVTHLVFFVLVCLDAWWTFAPKKPEKLRVKTVSLKVEPAKHVPSHIVEREPPQTNPIVEKTDKSEPVVTIVEKESPQTNSVMEKTGKSAPVAKKVEKPPIRTKSALKKTGKPEPVAKIVKKATPTPTQTPKKTKEEIQKKNQLLKEAQENIAKIHFGSAQPSSSLLHTPLNLKIDGMDQGENTKYIEELSSHLQTFLRLPEKGDVIVNLKIDRSGKVLDVGIVSSGSEKNQDYVKVNLPKIHFPSFTDELKNEKNHTFYITLSDIQ